MKRLQVNGRFNTTNIYIGESISNVASYIPKRTIIITDENLFNLYSEHFKSFKSIVIESGEDSKEISTIQHIYSKLVEYSVDRDTFLLGIGGGIISDITGFVASTVLRGIKFGFLSTTLLSQVDASIGGKNGVNFMGYKNIIGTINQPDFVICDTEILKSLPKKELYNGFAEVLKHALISDYEMFKFLDRKHKEAINLEPDVINKIITHSLIIKSKIIKDDEFEAGERRKLNFGHTIGHAIEKNYNILHGEAVSIGMMIAAKISNYRKLITNTDVNEIAQTLLNYNLPIQFNFDKELVFKHIRKDKKVIGDNIYFILLNKIGNAVIEEMKLTELEGLINDLC